MVELVRSFMIALSVIIGQWAGADAVTCEYKYSPKAPDKAFIVCEIEQPSFQLPVTPEQPRPNTKREYKF